MLRDARSCTWAVIASLLCLDTTINAQPQTLPLIVEQVQIVPARDGMPGGVAVTVRNIGTEVIEAWGVAGEVKYPNGTTRRMGVSTDTYETMSLPESLRPAADRSKRLLPGKSATITDGVSPTPPMEPTDAAAYPSFAVFEDDTAVGNERSIESIFSFRRLNQRVWRLAFETLTSALKQGLDDEQAAASTLAALEAAGKEVSQSIACSIVRRTLASYNPNKFQQLEMEIRSRLTAADKHAERRPREPK
jgi:hypothetical protein